MRALQSHRRRRTAAALTFLTAVFVAAALPARAAAQQGPTLHERVADLVLDGKLAEAERLVRGALRTLAAQHEADRDAIDRTETLLLTVLRRRDDPPGVRTLLEQRLARSEAAADTARLLPAVDDLAEFHAYRDTAEARRHLARAVAIREATLGPDHLDVAYTLERMARLQPDRDAAAANERMLERVRAIAQASGEERLLERTLDRLAYLRRNAGDLDAARAAFVERLALLEAQLVEERREGDDTASTVSDVLEVAGELASIHLALEDPARARPYFERAVAIRRASSDADERGGLHAALLQHAAALALAGDSAASAHARAEADSLLRAGTGESPESFYAHIAQALRAAGAPAAAQVVFDWASRVAPLGDLSTLTLPQLDTLYSRRYSLGRNEDALAVAKRRAELAESARGVGTRERMEYLRAYADMLAVQGQFGEARTVRDRLVTLAEREYGRGSNGVATELEALARLAFELGDYPAARGYAARALEITRAANDPEGPLVTSAMRLLARAHAAAGERDAARALLEDALRLDEKRGDARDVLVDLGTFLAEEGELASARAALERALALSREVFDPDATVQDIGASWLVHVIGPLADVLAAQAEHAAARAHYERAIRVAEGTLGPYDAATASLYARLGAMLLGSGDAGAAQAALERAVAITERVFGGSHPEVATRLMGLADVRAALGKRAEADSLVLQASGILDRYARTVLPTLSPGEQRAFIARLGDATARLLSDSSRIAPAQSYRFVGGWKGVLLHGLRRQVAIGRLRTVPAHARDVERLAAARTAVAHHFQRAGRMPAARWAALDDSLTTHKEQLERLLARALPPGATDDPWASLGDGGVAARLPATAALVDIHRHALAPARGAMTHRYTAVVSTRRGLARVDLGAAEAIDSLVARWRDAVIGGGAAGDGMVSLALAVWAPVAAVLPPEVARVWVSADAQLARVPWSVLAGGDGARLVAEVASPRALAQLLAAPVAMASQPGGEILLVGGVDFDAGGPQAGDGGWSSLPGTLREVEALAALARRQSIGALLVTGQQATPARIASALPGVRYAHVATHGFFFRETAGTYGSRGIGITPGANAEQVVTAAVRNPLAESGLALAGANAGPQGSITAEELLGIDLSRVALVVLSACETGRGTEITGQGVMGLRASFEAAGVGALVMSLWKVPDESTALLMEAFYGAMWVDRLSPAAALAKAQAAVRSDPRFGAPVHWAAWVLSGQGWTGAG